MTKILIGCTGSVATIKLPVLIDLLKAKHQHLEIRVILTEHAKHFCDGSNLPNSVKVYSDADEWAAWKSRGDPVLHIDLVKWADIFLIAPLDANTLAKIANGMCDNLLTCTARAWEIRKPLIFCPAMNTKMYEHPLTDRQIGCLIEFGYHHVAAIEKTLMCGDTGVGAMAEVDTIVEYVSTKFTNNCSFN